MTKLIAEPQERVSGPFTVTVNGRGTALETGETFTETDALLGALDSAGIAYEAVPLDAATGTASGRIRIPGTGSRQPVSINGKVQYLDLNEWFTPGTGVVEALTNGGVAYDTEYTDQTPSAFSFTDATDVATGSTQTSDTITVAGLGDDISVAVSITGGTYSKNGGSYVSTAGTAVNGDTFAVRHTASGSGGTATDTVLTIGGVSDTFTSTTSAEPTLGPELWPQPAFDASTGLTLNGWSVSEGKATSPASSNRLSATALETLTPGDYEVTMTVPLNENGQYSIYIGGAYRTPFFSGNTGLPVTKTLTAASITDQIIGVREDFADGGYTITDLSIKKLG